MSGGYGEEHVTRPIFKPLRDKFRVFGVPVVKFFIILGIGIACLGISAATGMWQHEVERAYSASEMQAQRSEYSSTLSALATIESQRTRQGASSYDEMSLNSMQKETVSKAKELGITASMTSEQAEALAPTTHIVSEPVVPDPVRFIVITALPVIVLFVLFMETNRTSLYKEIKRAWKWANSQKTYRNRPIEFVERKTGESYWDALPYAADPKGNPAG